jgi:predicted nucleic acid-binding protein
LTRFVLDCSVSAAWCLQDETSARATKVLKRLTSEEALVPSLWPVEMANVLTVAERKGRISAADAERAAELILTLPIVIDSHDGTILRRLRAIAREYDLSAYDGCYLELAQRLGLPLATLDRNLATAAKKSGIPLLL